MKFKIALIIVAVFGLATSCSHRLVGTWTVQKYQVVTPGEQGTTLSNIGTMSFDKDNTGKKQLDYNVLGIRRNDTAPFEWSATDKFVTVKGENSELTKTWIYIENKSKFQKWQSTDGNNRVQTLELTKE